MRRGAPAPSDQPVRGRGRPIVEYALTRIRASRVLQACLVAAFMTYGGLSFLLVSGRLAGTTTPYGPGFVLAATLTFLSLASWFFLFVWYPALERVVALTARHPSRRWIGVALETFAVGCVAVVHLVLAVIVVVLARR